MNIQTAILPHKHVRFSESLLGIAGFIKQRLNQPRTVDELYTTVESEAKEWPSRPSFTEVVLAVDVLFAIKLVRESSDGRIIAIPAGAQVEVSGA